MKEFKLSCPRCQQHIAVTEEWLGHRVTCPTCQAAFKIQAPALATASYPQAPAGLTLAHAAGSPSYPASATLDAGGLQTEHCQQCGRVLPLGASFCARCGVPSGTLPPPPTRSGWLPENLVAALPYVGGIIVPTLFMLLAAGVLFATDTADPDLDSVKRQGIIRAGLFALSPLVALLGLVSTAVAGLLCLALDKRSFVRWHAVQAVVLFVGGGLLRLGLGMLVGALVMGSVSFDSGGMPDFRLFGFIIGILRVVDFTFMVIVLLACLSALMGRNFRAPIAASFADAWAGEQ